MGQCHFQQNFNIQTAHTLLLNIIINLHCVVFFLTVLSSFFFLTKLLLITLHLKQDSQDFIDNPPLNWEIIDVGNLWTHLSLSNKMFQTTIYRIEQVITLFFLL